MGERIYKMLFSKGYPGYDRCGLQTQIEKEVDFETFSQKPLKSIRMPVKSRE